VRQIGTAPDGVGLEIRSSICHENGIPRAECAAVLEEDGNQVFGEEWEPFPGKKTREIFPSFAAARDEAERRYMQRGGSGTPGKIITWRSE
jgi:hypothetical protein